MFELMLPSLYTTNYVEGITGHVTTYPRILFLTLIIFSAAVLVDHF